jgi:hypothetical protein
VVVPVDAVDAAGVPSPPPPQAASRVATASEIHTFLCLNIFVPLIM